MPLRIASYNVRKCVGLDRRRNPERTLAVLQNIDADIIALQEADQRFGARISAIPLDLLERETGYKPVNFHTRPGGMGWHGNAILVRKEFDIISSEPLDLPTLEPRGAVASVVQANGHLIRIIGAHLDLSGLWRRKQVRHLIKYMDMATPYHPCVLMGDFNQWSQRGALSEFAFQRHRIIPLPPSFHAAKPVARLDRIVVSHEFEVLDAGVHICEHSVRASDHLPVWANLSLSHKSS